MQHPDEGMIHAWLDGALTVEEAATFEAHSAQCEQCSAAIAEGRGLVAASSRILLSLDDVPRGVIPVPSPTARVWYARNDLRVAAAMMLMAGATLFMTRRDVSSKIMQPEARAALESTADLTSALALESAAVAQPGTAVDAPAPAATSTPRLEAGTGPARTLRTKAAQRGTPNVVVASPPQESARTRGAARPEAASIARDTRATTYGAAPITRDKRAVTNEADFSGNRVAERSGTAVDSIPGRTSGSALRQLNSAVVTGAMTATASTAMMDASLDGSLEIVRADTAQNTRTIVYRTPAGVDITLTETDQTDLSRQSVLKGRAAGAKVNAPSARLDVPPAAPIAPAPAPERRARSVPLNNTISWMDPVTGTHYKLTADLPREQLEGWKTRIVKQKRSR